MNSTDNHMDLLTRINRRKRRRRPLRMLIVLLLTAWLASSLFQAYQPMPKGLSTSTPWRPADNAQVLLDQTWQASTGERISEQQIFDEVLAMISGARKLVVLDMFLFNDFAGQSSFRSLSTEVTAALIEARKRQPDLQAVLITDPFNTLYGGLENPALLALQRAGVDVLMTPIAALPASNALWSGLWNL